jgi:protein SCO1/2
MANEKSKQQLRKRGLAGWLWLVAVCLVALNSAIAGQTTTAAGTMKKEAGHKHSPPPAAAGATKTEAEFVVPDVAVLDQNGNKLKFYSDLVKGRKVVVNFVYTTCKGVCPMSGENFARLQARLGERLGRDVFMISVTTDPEVDSPARLKAWSDKYRPAQGWTLVTGGKEEITKLLRVLTGDGPKTGYHVPAVCVIDDLKKSQTWNYGLSAPEEIVKMIDRK